ncbi:MAG: heterodisulfide reductase-related iron-sulfur binding cluster [Actinomycetota bacterium]
MTRIQIGVDHDDLVACVSCGLCLPHCPTYRVTQDESASPRGRLAMMRLAGEGLEVDDRFLASMDSCIQCRACETACPAHVPYGRVMEATREALAEAVPSYVPRWKRLAYGALGRHRLLLAGSSALAVAQRLRLVPKRLGVPPLALRRPRLRPSGVDVWLFTGCVMDAWQRPVHAATMRVIEATGRGVALPGAAASCCGALHVHTGLGDDARALAERTMVAFPGTAPILVDSAGCGAQLKDYGHLLGTPEAERFAARVLDVHEWLADHVDELPHAVRRPSGPVAVQDPCHLRHVQGVHGSVRSVLAPFVDVVELDDGGMCCGAGGAYAVFEPELAGEVRDRKLASIERANGDVVVSANPGCSAHLQVAGVTVRHPMEIIDEAIGGSSR